MNRSANVTDFDAVRRLDAALVRFQGDAREGLDLLLLEVRKAVDWIENDRRPYWLEQVRRSSQRLVEVRNELERCQLKFGSEEAPSCYEQRQAVERARQRLRLCEEKVRVTQRWIREIRHAVDEFEGPVARLRDGLETDVPRGLAKLERMLTALEEYTGASGAESGHHAGPNPILAATASSGDPAEASPSCDLTANPPHDEAATPRTKERP